MRRASQMTRKLRMLSALGSLRAPVSGRLSCQPNDRSAGQSKHRDRDDDLVWVPTELTSFDDCCLVTIG